MNALNSWAKTVNWPKNWLQTAPISLGTILTFKKSAADAFCSRYVGLGTCEWLPINLLPPELAVTYQGRLWDLSKWDPNESLCQNYTNALAPMWCQESTLDIRTPCANLESGYFLQHPERYVKKQVQLNSIGLIPSIHVCSHAIWFNIDIS